MTTTRLALVVSLLVVAVVGTPMSLYARREKPADRLARDPARAMRRTNLEAETTTSPSPTEKPKKKCYPPHSIEEIVTQATVVESRSALVSEKPEKLVDTCLASLDEIVDMLPFDDDKLECEAACYSQTKLKEIFSELAVLADTGEPMKLPGVKSQGLVMKFLPTAADDEDEGDSSDQENTDDDEEDSSEDDSSDDDDKEYDEEGEEEKVDNNEDEEDDEDNDGDKEDSDAMARAGSAALSNEEEDESCTDDESKSK